MRRLAAFAFALALLCSFTATHVAAQDAVPPAPQDTAPVAEPAAPAPESSAPAAEQVVVTRAAESPPAPAPPAPTAAVVKLVVIDAAPYGIDPIVSQHVTATMRRVGAEVGYATLSMNETVAAARSIAMPYPPAPADLWRVTQAAGALRGAFARAWTQEGKYVVEIVVASMDGGGPFFAREMMTAEQLDETVARMFRAVLPPPNVSTAGMPPSGVDRVAPNQLAAPAITPSVTGTAPRENQSNATNNANSTTRRRRRVRQKPQRWVLSLQTEGAIGVNNGGFYNHLVGARVDFRITPTIRVGASLSYVNLQGTQGRVDNLLVMIQAENRVRISPSLSMTVPLRVSAGYLPYNGPVVRASAGLAFPIGRSFDIVADILAPTFWILPEGVRISMDLALEVGWKF